MREIICLVLVTVIAATVAIVLLAHQLRGCTVSVVVEWDVMNPPLDADYRRLLASIDQAARERDYRCDYCGQQLPALTTEVRRTCKVTDLVG